jgi:hypothetical protein
MSALFKKLNLGAHPAIGMFNPPASFEPELKTLQGVTIEREQGSRTAWASCSPL